MKNEIQLNEIKIFSEAFSTSIWKNKDRISLLKRNLKNIENRIEYYLDKITEVFPNLTDHSIKHSQMLWNYANIIVGEQKGYLNPMEAFVLHCAFLIHDSGMCYSILGNRLEIENDPIYLDFLSGTQSSESKKEDALFYTIRMKHGDYALRVATEKLEDGGFLIEDVELREELGQIIGKIAKSHTCELNYIEREFGAKYITPKFPTKWGINCQKIALILRCSDAAHLDNLRTPKTNRMIDKIKGVSHKHWTFQKKLGFPSLSYDNYLEYSTSTPFSENQQQAWWFCYSALKVLDKEIKRSNEYFTLNGAETFRAKGVKSIDDTLMLGASYIRTKNWEAIDTNIRVNNPVGIASELGGEKLYGLNHFAVRELIQNSLDAISLYRIYTEQNTKKVGEIEVRMEQKGKDIYLTITDNGIGMSRTLMTGELLDFGGSYWRSSRFTSDFKGLKSKGFESIGKFGIGFFSSFMLGDEISVTSWKYGLARNDMFTLDFYDGLFTTPLLRKPYDEEKNSIIDRGTRISIKLKAPPYNKEGFIGKLNWNNPTLYDLIKYHIPNPGAIIKIIENIDGHVRTNTIEPDTFLNMEYEPMVEYLNHGNDSFEMQPTLQVMREFKMNLVELKHNDKIVGRLSILPQVGSYIMSNLSVVISKGIRINQLGGLAGYLLVNEVVTIRRDKFNSNIPYDSVRNWAVQQIKVIDEQSLDIINSGVNENAKTLTNFLLQWPLNELKLAFNLYDKSITILLSRKDHKTNFVSMEMFEDYLANNDEVKLYQKGFSTTEPKSIDGFYQLSRRLSLDSLVQESDKTKIIKYDDFLEGIIKDHWGSFLKSTERPNGSIFNLEFASIITYKKSY